MPLKINLSVARKLGTANYGSISAGCAVEFEADSGLMQSNPDGFHKQVSRAYVACHQAVQAELARQQQVETPCIGSTSDQSEVETPVCAAGAHQSYGNGNNGRNASEKQMEYARQLARQISGLGVRRLENLAQKMFGKPLASLTSLDGSGLIDCLKDIKSGKIDLSTVLDGATA